MAEFTPGPWKIEKLPAGGDGEPALWYVVNDAGDPSEEYDLYERGAEADARLMAAAPELLSACKALLEIQDEPSHIATDWDRRHAAALNRMDAAIARAEGRED